MANVNRRDIWKLVFNFLSLPVFAIILILITWGIGKLGESGPKDPDSGFGDLGWAIFIIYLIGFELLILFLWWNYRVIRTIISYKEIKLLKRSHITILIYPYSIAAYVFISNYISDASINNAINSKIIDTKVTTINFGGTRTGIITWAATPDSTFIITSTPAIQQTTEMETIIRLIPYGIYRHAYAEVTNLPAGSIGYNLCKDTLVPYNGTPPIYVSTEVASLGKFFSNGAGKGYVEEHEHFLLDPRASIERPLLALNGDSLKFNMLGDLNTHCLRVVDMNNSVQDYYEPLKGFFGQNARCMYYDKSDNSIYALVSPGYYNIKKEEQAQVDKCLYIAKFNKKTIVYKVKTLYNISSLNLMFVGIFKSGNNVWVLNSKVAFCIKVQ